jgi:hypothetical protein
MAPAPGADNFGRAAHQDRLGAGAGSGGAGIAFFKICAESGNRRSTGIGASGAPLGVRWSGKRLLSTMTPTAASATNPIANHAFNSFI